MYPLVWISTGRKGFLTIHIYFFHIYTYIYTIYIHTFHKHKYMDILNLAKFKERSPNEEFGQTRLTMPSERDISNQDEP